jgi:hypothetical protein
MNIGTKGSSLTGEFKIVGLHRSAREPHDEANDDQTQE